MALRINDWVKKNIFKVNDRQIKLELAKVQQNLGLKYLEEMAQTTLKKALLGIRFSEKDLRTKSEVVYRGVQNNVVSLSYHISLEKFAIKVLKLYIDMKSRLNDNLDDVVLDYKISCYRGASVGNEDQYVTTVQKETDDINNIVTEVYKLVDNEIRSLGRG